MTEPRKALGEAGAETPPVSSDDATLEAWKFTECHDAFRVDMPLGSARQESFDRLRLPGGLINPDTFATLSEAMAFPRAFFDAGRPAASICPRPWIITEAGGTRRGHLTSWPSLPTDLQSAGAEWVDRNVVVDHDLVTSRKPDDMPAVNRAMIRLSASAQRQSRQAVAE